LAVDADGSNALHTLMESSRELRTAELLLELGLDGYVQNGRGRSALSMAIEALPELAALLLAAKARFEYRWCGCIYSIYIYICVYTYMCAFLYTYICICIYKINTYLYRYRYNRRGRSALSMAIEALPELAALLFAAKARFECRW